MAQAANPREQPGDRGRAVRFLRIENDRRREPGRQGGLERVGQPVLIRVVEGQRPGAPDRRDGGAAWRMVPATNTVDQSEEEQPADDDESQGPGETVDAVV